MKKQELLNQQSEIQSKLDQIEYNEHLSTITGISFPEDNKFIEFSEVFEENYENNYQSQVFNNSEFDYRIFISVHDHNCTDEMNEGENLIFVSVSKTKKYINKKQLQNVANSSGLTIKEIQDIDINDYGYQASLFSFHTYNVQELELTLNHIANTVPVITMMFGFYMDKVQNRIGNTGWDFLNGNIGFK